jgi:hypothetical protein|tara:strand:- start:57 stop:197 length:141 start_codon:yes stop_codon:yes gene_type:complete
MARRQDGKNEMYWYDVVKMNGALRYIKESVRVFRNVRNVYEQTVYM